MATSVSLEYTTYHMGEETDVYSFIFCLGYIVPESEMLFISTTSSIGVPSFSLIFYSVYPDFTVYMSIKIIPLRISVSIQYMQVNERRDTGREKS